jgi:hypothetical protein
MGTFTFYKRSRLQLMGDLWIERTDLFGHNIDSIAVHGFGHGVSMGVEPNGSGACLWTEYQASSSGYGSRIARFPYRPGAVLEVGDGSIRDCTPNLPGLVTPQAFVDPKYDRYYVRFQRQLSNGTYQHRLGGYRMSDAVARNLDSNHRLVEVRLPTDADVAVPGQDPSPGFQGWAVCGSWFYQLEGDADTNGSKHAYLSNWEIDTGTVADVRFQTNAGQSLKNREPQGMAIWVAGGNPRLAFGFVGRTGGSQYTPGDVYNAAVF